MLLHPKVDAQTSRVWVKAVVLTKRVYQSQNKIEANASGQVGDVVGVKTGIYRKSDTELKSVDIAFEAFDIDLLAAQFTKPDGTIKIFTPGLKFPAAVYYNKPITGTIK